MASLVEQYIDAAVARGLHCSVTISRPTNTGLVQRYVFNYSPEYEYERDVFFLSMINPCNLLETDNDAFEWNEPYTRDDIVYRLLCKMPAGWQIGLMSAPISGNWEDSDSE